MKLNADLLTYREHKELRLLLIGKHGDVTVSEARERLMPNYRLWDIASFVIFTVCAVIGILFFVPLLFIGMVPAVISTVYLRNKTDKLLMLMPYRHDKEIIDLR